MNASIRDFLKKPHIVGNQLRVLIEEILEPENEFADFTENTCTFTTRLYYYFTKFCGFSPCRDKTSFFTKYFRNPLACKALFFQLFHVDGIVGKETKNTKWWEDYKDFHEKVLENIRDYEEILIEYLDLEVQIYQLELARSLAESAGFKLDINKKLVYSVGVFSIKTLLADALLKKYGIDLHLAELAKGTSASPLSF